MVVKIPEKEYKKILENIPVCCVDIVVCHNNKVILILRKTKPVKDKWWLPGGRIYKNEKLEEAAIRKVYEEIGLKVRIEKKIGVYETMFHDGPFNDFGVHTINICFLAKSEENPSIKLNKHHLKYKWIVKIEKDLHPYLKQVLKDSQIFD
ncbi:GDP-mannose mannosyl hydrolase [subsurface metagenome]